MKKLALISLAAVAASSAFGQAWEFSGISINYTNGYWSLGCQFDVLNPVSVYALGSYDDNGDGFLSGSQDVGIFDMSSNLLASTTVTSSDTLLGHFRYASITPLYLAAGRYMIASTTGIDNYTWATSGFYTDPNIAFVTDAYSASATLVAPTGGGGTAGGDGWWGPNMLIHPVPEPASMAVLGLGLLAVVRRRK
ncbi:MAG: PEP-CTERM sorting domain-containing protein [Armatimonadetes bacterium]|nr:PEP-CTERM sorting domain-containing protein [Armatimonadota bacterium]